MLSLLPWMHPDVFRIPFFWFAPMTISQNFVSRAEKSRTEKIPAKHGLGKADVQAIDAPPAAAPPAISDELVARFHELLDEVTDELMKAGPDMDRGTCREDAITLLVATSKHLPDAPESPLVYLLREEQQKSAALAGRAAPLTFMKV